MTLAFVLAFVPSNLRELTEESLQNTKLLYPCIYFAKDEADLKLADDGVFEVLQSEDEYVVSMVSFMYLLQEDEAEGVARLGYDPGDLPFVLTVGSSGFVKLQGSPSELPRMCLRNFKETMQQN